MRLSFPNKEHADVLMARGDTAVGASQDNAIVLTNSGIAEHHVRFELSERCIVMRVVDSAARVHVNARPVRSLALLHPGDIVSLGTIQLVLKPDRDDNIRVTLPATESADRQSADDAGSGPSRVVLRGVSGAYFGRSIPVNSRLVIGNASDSGLQLDETGMVARHAQIENVGDAIFLRDLGSSNGTSVNGVQVRNAVLYPDDQIAFERNRFLLEAPGLPLRDAEERFDDDEANITQSLRAVPRPETAVDADTGTGNVQVNSSLWWLIGVAAVIAAGLAVLFFTRG